MSATARAKRVSPPDVTVECLGCAWTSTAANGLGTAALHHDRTGHAVYATVKRTVTFGDPTLPPPGQTTLTVEEDPAP